MEAQHQQNFVEQDDDTEEIVPLKRWQAKLGQAATGLRQLGDNDTESHYLSNATTSSHCSVSSCDLSSDTEQGYETHEKTRKLELECDYNVVTGDLCSTIDQGSEYIDKPIEESKRVENQQNFLLPNDLSSQLSKRHTLDDFNGLMISETDVNGTRTADQHNMENEALGKYSETAESDDMIEEVEQNTEYEVEKVLAEQNTHDLYCPNCSSCITRRVILRRKRPKVLHRKKKLPKQDKIKELETEVGTNLSENNEHLPVSDIHSLDAITEDNKSDRKVDVFRCLSCFTFFIPYGTGFKLFQPKSRTEAGNEQASTQDNAVKKNWFSSIFSSEETKIRIKEDVSVVIASESSDQFGKSPSIAEETQAAGDVEASSQEVDKRKRKSPYRDIAHIVSVLSVLKAKEVRTDSSNPSASEIQEVNQYEVESQQKDITSFKEEDKDTPSLGQITTEQINSLSSLLDQFYQTAPLAGELEEEERTLLLQEMKIDDGKKVLTFAEERETLTTIIDNKDPGNNLTVVIEKEPRRTGSYQVIPTAGDLTEPRSTTQVNQMPTATQRTGVNVLSCIVYGGLAELITSLGVLSSAAGAGAATATICAIGLANLAGGFFILVHNILDLKHDQSKENTVETTDRERFLVLRALRTNFLLYAMVILLSYVVFGALPPLLYCTTFSSSGSRDYKMILAAIVAILFIGLLALGKARNGNESYTKTASYFVTLGILASGSSFVVGDFISWLLERLGWFQTNALTLGPPESVHRFWASY